MNRNDLWINNIIAKETYISVVQLAQILLCNKVYIIYIYVHVFSID